MRGVEMLTNVFMETDDPLMPGFWMMLSTHPRPAQLIRRAPEFLAG
jgi:hypothetical protein